MEGKERRTDVGTKVMIALLIFTVSTILGLYITSVWNIAWGADRKANEACSDISSIKRYIDGQEKINAQLTAMLSSHDNRIRDLEKAR